VLVERGAIGLAILLLTGAAILMTGVRRLRGTEGDVALHAAAALGIVAALVITGMFDAVLLSPSPAFLTAVALGVLLPRTRPVIERSLAGRPRRMATLGAIGITVLVTTYSAMQFLAIRKTSDASTRATIAQAVRIDPTSYRLQLQLARRGNCSARIPHARAATRLMPYHEAPRRALTACGVAPPR
jgi:hypothetical protein